MTQPQYLPPQYSPQYSPIPQYSPPPPQPPKSHKVRKRIGLVLAFVLGGVIVIGVPLVGYQALGAVITKATPTLPIVVPPTKFTVSGTVRAQASLDLYDASDGDLCYTTDGYDDIKDGAQIEVQNGEGATVALGTLAPGIKDGLSCVFGFTIADIPEGEQIYTFRAGNSVRGGMKFTRQQLKDQGETIALGFS